MASAQPATLPQVLHQIWMTELPAAERRWLVSAAVGREQLAHGNRRATAHEVMDAQERVLLDIGRAMGVEKPRISEAKALLRDRGAPALANRLGTLSKGRNAIAHGDLSLANGV